MWEEATVKVQARSCFCDSQLQNNFKQRKILKTQFKILHHKRMNEAQTCSHTPRDDLDVTFFWFNTQLQTNIWGTNWNEWREKWQETYSKATFLLTSNPWVMCQESCCSNEGQSLLYYLLKRLLVNQMPVVFWIPTANVWKISGPQEGICSFSFIMLLCWLLWARWQHGLQFVPLDIFVVRLNKQPLCCMYPTSLTACLTAPV